MRGQQSRKPIGFRQWVVHGVLTAIENEKAAEKLSEEKETEKLSKEKKKKKIIKEKREKEVNK